MTSSAKWQAEKRPGTTSRSGGTVGAAHVLRHPAARVERAARRDPQQVRRQAADGGEGLPLLVQARDRLEQAPGVGVRRAPRRARGPSARLDDAAGIHDGDPVGDVGDDAEVVRDQDEPHLALLLQLLQQVHDLRLHGDVERRRRLVGDEHRRVEREGHRDHDALAHAAGELVRVVLDALARRPGSTPAPSARSPARGRRTCSCRGGCGTSRRSASRPGTPGSARTARPGRSSRSRARG